MNIKVFLGLVFLVVTTRSNSQVSKISGFAGIDVNAISKDDVPFWLRSNQFGDIPLSGISTSARAGLYKDFDSVGNPTFDWSMGLSGRLNVGSSVKGILTEGYIKLALSEFQFSVGRTKDVIGLMDTALSSGSFSSSGNALGIPKLEVAVPNYYTIPILGNIFSVKGNFAYGWVGPMQTQAGTKLTVGTNYHQKSLYIKFGRPNWRLNLIGGFNHQVMFGNEKKIFTNFKLNYGESFLYAVEGKTYQGSKVGNHLGSIDFGLTYEFPSLKLFLYRQNFYDEGALAKLANLRDGLNGISFTHTGIDKTSPGFVWRKFLVELFYSKDQAGYPWSRRTNSGDENYYNNYEYVSGWSYKGAALGNPLVTAAVDSRPFDRYVRDYFNNNRIIALNLGFIGSIDRFDMLVKTTLSKNYGTFATSPYGISTGHIHSAPVGTFPEVNQMSILFGTSTDVGQNYKCSLLLAIDNGKLLYNTQGVIVKLQKSF